MRPRRRLSQLPQPNHLMLRHMHLRARLRMSLRSLVLPTPAHVLVSCPLVCQLLIRRVYLRSNRQTNQRERPRLSLRRKCPPHCRPRSHPQLDPRLTLPKLPHLSPRRCLQRVPLLSPRKRPLLSPQSFLHLFLQQLSPRRHLPRARLRLSPRQITLQLFPLMILPLQHPRARPRLSLPLSTQAWSPRARRRVNQVPAPPTSPRPRHLRQRLHGRPLIYRRLSRQPRPPSNPR